MPLKLRVSIRAGAIISLAGFILSAPVAVALVMLIAPQPSWVSVEVFKANYHPIQELPYFFGFVLVAGLLVLVLGHKKEDFVQPAALHYEIQLAHALVVIFATVVSLNYICQTTFIPHLLRTQVSVYDPIIATFTMSNPDSLSWSVEMWGYLILAIALWFLRGCYQHQPTSLPALLTANLVLSAISLVWTIVDAKWVETALGLVLYFAWNTLMIMIVILFIRQSAHLQKNPIT